MRHNRILFLLFLSFFVIAPGRTQELTDELKATLVFNEVVQAIEREDYNYAEQNLHIIDSFDASLPFSYNYYSALLFYQMKKYGSAKDNLEKIDIDLISKSYQDEIDMFSHKASNIYNDLDQELNRLQRTYSKQYGGLSRSGVGFIFLGSSALFGGLSVLFWVLSDNAFNDYLNTSITEDAVMYREQAEIFDVLKVSALSVAGGAFVTSAIFFGLNIKPVKMKKRIAEIELLLE